MKTRKLFVVILALVLTMSMTATAFADDTITSLNDSVNADVSGTYNKTTSGDVVYSVDVTWGAMDFTYNVSSTGTWNPKTHEYDATADTPIGWTYTEDHNKFTVTNHSNAGVKAIFAFANLGEGSTSSNVNGNFNSTTKGDGTAKDAITLATAVGTASTEAPTDTTYLILSGELGSSHTQGEKIGTVTVTLAAN